MSEGEEQLSTNQHYERKVIEQEGEKLRYYTEIGQIKRNKEEEDQMFMNLSIRELLRNTSFVFIAILNDIVSGEIKTFKDFISVFFKGNRMAYIGIIIVFIAFSVYIIDITS